MRKNRLWLYLTLFLCVGMHLPVSGQGDDPTTESQKEAREETSTVYLYRIVNWCVVGRGEYELNEWPMLQFRPLLRRDHKVRDYEDNFKKEKSLAKRDDYENPEVTLEFKTIKCHADEKDREDDTHKWLGKNEGQFSTFLQRTHVRLKVKDQVTDKGSIEGVIIQAVHAPFGLGFPFGQFDIDAEFTCSDCKHGTGVTSSIGCITRPGLSLLHPTVGAFHFQHKRNGTSPGRRKELHWNFKWADSPCSPARVVEFWVMIVLSFSEKVWFTQKFGPYDFSIDPAKRIKVEYSPTAQPPYAFVQPDLPTPIFPSCRRRCNYTHLQDGDSPTEDGGVQNVQKECPLEAVVESSKIECEGTVDYPFTPRPEKNEVNFDKTGKWSPIRFPGDFDVDCIEKYPVKTQPYKVCKTWQSKFFCQGNDKEDDVFNEPELQNTDYPNRTFPNSFCKPCSTKKPTLPPKNVDPELGLIKRTPHSILMIVSFFFILPLSTFTIRFYKETLHTVECKGWRLWLMIHASTNMLILVLCYASYSIVTFWKMDPHMYTGYATTFVAIGAFFSGWGRHKNFYLKWTFVIVHLGCGYASYGLALTSFIIHRRVGIYAKYAAILSCVLSIAAILIMSIHIFVIDNKLGIIPKRSQFPIVDIQFDDIFPPGHKFRLIFLGTYAVLLLIVCFFMVGLE